MIGIHACHSVCILMYKQMYTYICISYNIWKWIGNNHILYNTLSSSNLQRALWVRFLSCLGAQIYIQLAVWDQTVNVTLKAVAELYINHGIFTLPWHLFGLFAAGGGNTNTRCSVAEGLLVKTNTHARAHVLTPAAPILSDEWGDPRYKTRIKIRQENSTNNEIKANQTVK